MCDKQYDMSDRMRKLFEEKQKQRLAAKTYYRNLLYNPHLPPDQGVPFDPAALRYGAMSVYHYQIYKPKFKQFAAWFLALSPILILTAYMHCKKAEEERLIRSGLVAYADREFKKIL